MSARAGRFRRLCGPLAVSSAPLSSRTVSVAVYVPCLSVGVTGGRGRGLDRRRAVAEVPEVAVTASPKSGSLLSEPSKLDFERDVSGARARATAAWAPGWHPGRR